MPRSTAILLLLLTAAPLAAQTPAGPDAGGSIHLVPRAGRFAFDDTDGVPFRGGIVGLDLASSLGVGLDFASPLPWLGFRVGIDRGIGTGTSDRTGVAEEASLTVLSMDARLQPVPASWRVRPFVALGAAWLGVSVEDSRDRYAGSVRSAGLDVDLGRWPLRVEVVHRFYEPEDLPSQAHLLFTAGVAIPLR